MAIEDFTTYTEVDSGGDITVTASKIDVSSMQKQATSYVYKDYGAGYFDTSLEHDVDITIASASAGAWGGYWAVNNTAETMVQMDTNNRGIAGFLYRFTGAPLNYGLYIRAFDNANDSDNMQIGLAVPYERYLTIKRIGTTVTVDIYTDASRTTKEDTITCTSSANNYSKIFGCVSNGTAGQTQAYTYDMENLNLSPSRGITTYGRLRGVVHWGI